MRPLRMNTVNFPRAAVSILKAIGRTVLPASQSRLLRPRSCHPGAGHKRCTRAPKWISLEIGMEREIGVTESWEVPGFRESNGGLPAGVFLYVELFDFQIQRRPRNSESDSGSIWSGNLPVALRQRGLDEFLLIAVDGL